MAHEEYIRLVPGADTAVLFIHGILGTPNHFQKLIPLVPENCTICNLLLPGHGGTVDDFSRSSMEQWRKYVEEKIRMLLADHKRILISAHSMGTLLAIEQAVDKPQHIGGLFLLAAPLRIRLRWQMIMNAWCVFRGNVSDNDPLLSATRDACSIAQDKNIFRYLGWVPRYLELFSVIFSVRKILPKLCVPGVVFQSRADEMVSIGSVSDLEESKLLNVAVLEHSRHFYYSPEDMADIMDAFGHFVGTCNIEAP